MTMVSRPWEVVFHDRPNGRCPTQEFLEKLTRKEVAYIFNNGFDRLEEHGRELDRPYVGFLRGKIWELIVDYRKVRYRFLYFFIDGHKFVITHGIKKKSKKVPDKEIDKAMEYREEYLLTHRKE